MDEPTRLEHGHLKQNAKSVTLLNAQSLWSERHARLETSQDHGNTRYKQAQNSQRALTTPSSCDGARHSPQQLVESRSIALLARKAFFEAAGHSPESTVAEVHKRRSPNRASIVA